MLSSPEAVIALTNIGVDVAGLVDVAQEIYTDSRGVVPSTRSPSTHIHVEIMLHMRSSNAATVRDIFRLQSWMAAQLERVASRGPGVGLRQKTRTSVQGGLQLTRRSGDKAASQFKDGHVEPLTIVDEEGAEAK